MSTHDGLRGMQDGSRGVEKEKRREKKRQVPSYEVTHLVTMYIMYGTVYRVRNTV